MRAELWGAVFGAAIFLRMVLCAVCMRRGSDHLVRLGILGLLAGGLGLIVAPLYAELEVPVDLLLTGSLAVYLYADRRSIGACGATCPYDVALIVEWLDRWRRPLACALLVAAFVAMITAGHAADPPDFHQPPAAGEPGMVPASSRQLTQLIAYTNALVDEVARLKVVAARGGCT